MFLKTQVTFTNGTIKSYKVEADNMNFMAKMLPTHGFYGYDHFTNKYFSVMLVNILEITFEEIT